MCDDDVNAELILALPPVGTMCMGVCVCASPLLFLLVVANRNAHGHDEPASQPGTGHRTGRPEDDDARRTRDVAPPRSLSTNNDGATAAATTYTHRHPMSDHRRSMTSCQGIVFSPCRPLFPTLSVRSHTQTQSSPVLMVGRSEMGAVCRTNYAHTHTTH